jgi:starch synthase (maltosyl-transferring)
VRDWDAAEREGRTLAPYLTRLNTIRREHPALQRLRNLRFHATDTPAVLCYSKYEGSDIVIVVVNLDPHGAREDAVHLDLAALGLPPGRQLAVRDEITGQQYTWGEHNYVRLDPFVEPAHILTVRSTSP